MTSVLELHVQLNPPQSTGSPGYCLELESLQDKMLAAVLFEPALAPVLALGSRVELEFSSPHCLKVEVEAQTVSRSDEPGSRSYGFRCDISKRLFLHLLNRRRAPRVRLAPSQALPVRLLDVEGEILQGSLFDVSTVGLSIQVEADVERELCARSGLRLALRLPGDEQGIELGAVIRRRKLFGTGVLYGLELDEATLGTKHGNDRFLRYVEGLLEAHAPPGVELGGPARTAADR
jgi:hypothetical protein